MFPGVEEKHLLLVLSKKYRNKTETKRETCKNQRSV